MQSLLLRKEVCRDGVNSQRCMMTELQNTNNEVSAQNSGVVSQQSMSQSVNAGTQPPRYYTDEDVNSILSAKKDKWMEKGYEKAKSEYSQQNSNAGQQGFSPAANFDKNNAINFETIKEIAEKAAEQKLNNTIQAQHFQMQEMQKLQEANELEKKMISVKDNYPDIEKTILDLQLNQHPELWRTANQYDADTAAAIFDEMKKNVDLYSSALTLKNNPVMLKEKMQQLANSIKQNKEAEAAKKANPPLSRQMPSTVGAESGKDKSEFTVQDWKKILRV